MSAKPTDCPFCKRGNQCMVSNIDQCWCKSKVIPVSMLALLPDKRLKVKSDMSCVCAACVDAYIVNSEKFKAKYLL